MRDRDVLDYIETNPDDPASRLLAALLSDRDYFIRHEKIARERCLALEKALVDARGRILAIGHEGWDSSRRRLTETAVDVIDKVLTAQ